MAAESELDLIVQLKGDAEKQLRELGGATEQAGQKSGLLQQAFAFATGGALLSGITSITSGLTGMFTDGFADARGSVALMAQTENVLKSTGGAAGVSADHIAEYAAALSDASGASLFGDDQIQESQNLLLTFTNIKGSVLDAATAIGVDMAQALGGAPKDSAIQLGKALNDPIAGISALSRVGVSFTEQQKEQIKTMQESGDVAGAQGIILAELNKEFGGSAAAAAAADGGWAQFKGTLGEAAETIASGALPGIQQLGSALADPANIAAISAIASALGEQLGAAITWISQTAIPWLTDTALPAAQAAFETVWPVIQTAVGAVYDFLSGTVWPWLQNSAFPWIIGTALPALQAVFQAVWPVIQAAVNTVYTFLSGTVWPWLRDTAFPWIIGTGLPAVQNAFNTVWPVIQSAVSTVYHFLMDTVWPFLQRAFADAATWVEAMRDRWDTAIAAARTTIETIQTTVETVRTNVETAVTALKGYFTAGWETVKTTVSGVWSAIQGYIEAPINAASATVATVIATIKSVVQGGIDLVNSLIRAINSIPAVPNIPTIPGFAGGVSNFGGGLAVVGERGRELVALPRGSSVTPNAQTERLLADSAGGDTYYIDARGSTLTASQIQDSFERALRAVGRKTDTRIRTR